MAKKLFNTIYGRNLVGELKNIVQRPYLVVTMEDLWETFKEEFDEDCIVHFVKTLEYDEIMAEVEKHGSFTSRKQTFTKKYRCLFARKVSCPGLATRIS